MGLIGTKDLFGKIIYNEWVRGDISVRMIPCNLAREIIVSNHYSKSIVKNSYINIGLFNKNDIVGVAQFGYALNTNSCSNIVKHTKNNEYIELNRLWVSDSMPRNTESTFFGACVKLIKHNYPKIDWIQSFADERCNNLGVVYQACNFLYCGYHESEFLEFDGNYYHKLAYTLKDEFKIKQKGGKKARHIMNNIDKANKVIYRQFRYIYFINKNRRSDLLLPILPYPKKNEQQA